MKLISMLKDIGFCSFTSVILLATPSALFATNDSTNFFSVYDNYVTTYPNTKPIIMTRTQAQGTNQGSPARAYNANVQCSSGSSVFTFQQNISQSFSGDIPILGSIITRTKINLLLTTEHINVIYGYIRGAAPTLISKGFDDTIGGPFSWVENIIKSAGYSFYVSKILQNPSMYDIVCWSIQPQIQWRST